MTIQERLRIIGLTLRGESTATEIIREVEAKQKQSLGGFLDFGKQLISETGLSGRILQANKGWVYRNNDVIAKEVATIEFELYSTKYVGQEIQYNEITTHPLLDALDKFNDFTDASSGFYITQSHKKLAGNCFWYIDRTGININNIYILPPDKVKVVVGKVEAGQKAIASYEYRDSVQGKPVNETYKPEEIVHFKVPDPANSILGKSTVAAAADDIDMDIMAIEANKQMFKRGLIGNFILSTDKSMTPEQIRNLQEELRGKYGSVENAFKVLVLSGGLEPKSVQLTNKDMEFIAQQQWVRDKIASIFGNNKAVLGVTDDVNRANAEATIEQWKRTTIRAEMKQITDTLNEFLVPLYGKNLILGFKDPVPEDKDIKIQQVSQLIGSNVITPDEARELLGYEPLNDETSTTLRSSLNIPVVPPVPKSLKHVNLSRFLRKSGILEQQERYLKAVELARPIAEKIVKGKQKYRQPMSELNILAYYEKQMSIIDHAEQQFKAKVVNVINRLVKTAINELPHEYSQMQQKALLNKKREIANAVLDLTPILNEVAIASGHVALDAIDSEEPYLLGDLRQTLHARAVKFVTSLVETDEQKMVDILEEGVRQGRGVAAVARDIASEFDDYSVKQATSVARTEIANASTQASLDAWAQSDQVVGKQWLAEPDAVDECADLNGEVVYDLGGDFYSDDSEFTDGDPPLHPNCRCAVLPVLANEKNLDPNALLTISQKAHIKKLEAKVDKRTTAYKELKAKANSQHEYIKELEEYLNE